ncbi:glycerol kinase, variant [Aphanomyces invadans]|uniref:glycerol kinase n=1 Tax=Aphanomyces invadans TaxID=157072 RepID=A0A024TE58_9STRA|nr:glycerol kinase, variant [Aphanomyces invadans]ETV92304.1 glycerol kinase, variant [Aphanomyces invadans]|eukprot:XP_008879055.1 glycerol kinase, variant [Aphanomyces invadans]
MTTQLVGAIDQGTTSSRFILFNTAGKIVASHQLEHDQIQTHPGWCEHDADQIWSNVHECIAQTMKHGPGATVSAIGITNQRETSLLWDKVTGKPVYNALVWHDMRTADIVYELLEGHDINRFRATTGLPLATYFSAVKIMWLLRNVPGLRANAEAGNVLFGTIDTWLLWKLSGGAVHATDVSNASRTNLMDLSTLDWSEELLCICDIPRAILPAIRSSSEVYATTAVNFVLPNVPIAGMLGDQQAAMFGQTCFKPGEAKNTYGTGCFFMMNTGTDAISSTKGLLTTVGYKLGNEPCVYALEGSVAVAGKVVQWLRDNMKIITKPSDIEGLALAVPDNGGCYFVPAFSGLYAPYWRSDARGVICGLTGFVTREHLARASLEAVAFQVMDVVHAMQDEAKIELSSLRVDGGMIENDLLMQIQADILDTNVVRPVVAETTALGAAFAAGLAVGVWMNTDDLVKTWHVAKVWRSNMQHDARAKLTSEWKKAIARTLNWTE